MPSNLISSDAHLPLDSHFRKYPFPHHPSIDHLAYPWNILAQSFGCANRSWFANSFICDVKKMCDAVARLSNNWRIYCSGIGRARAIFRISIEYIGAHWYAHTNIHTHTRRMVMDVVASIVFSVAVQINRSNSSHKFRLLLYSVCAGASGNSSIQSNCECWENSRKRYGRSFASVLVCLFFHSKCSFSLHFFFVQYFVSFDSFCSCAMQVHHVLVSYR